MINKFKYIFWSVFTLGLPILTYAQPAPVITSRSDIDANKAILIVLSVAKWLLVLFGVITVIIALWSAFLFVTGGSNEDQVTKAKKILIFAVVGTIVAILSFSVVSFTESLFETPTTGARDECGGCPDGQSCRFNNEANFYVCR